MRDNSILDELETASSEFHDDMMMFEKKVEDSVGRIIEAFVGKVDLAEQMLEAIPMHYDESGLWWVWNSAEKKWHIRDEIDILNLVANASGANVISSKERTEIINALKQLSRMRKPEKLPADCIQFEDEIVELKTGRRFKASPMYFITNPIPWKLGKKIETPVMDKIFEEWVGKDNVQTLYEILAYSILSDYPIGRIFCFIGGGSNGKSCFLNLLRKFVGEGNCCSTELDTLIASRFEVTRLYKKLVCQMGETNFGEMSKTSMLKKLSGRDLIGFEYKNKTPFEEINYAKIIIATNNLPSTTDKTIGFYRRWMIVDFPNQFDEKKDILADIPEEEYNNLAAKSLDILIGLLKKREFTNEGSVEDRMKRYEAKSNFLNSFLEEFTSESFDEFITKNEFKNKFTDWCKANRHRDMSDLAVAKAMKTRGIESGKTYFNWMNEGKGGQARTWQGLKWN